MQRTEIPIPEDITAETDRFDVIISGPEGEVRKRLWYPDVSVSIDDDAVIIESERTDAKTSAIIGTFESNVTNMIVGVTDGWEYEMEIHYAHFPMQVRVDGDDVVIENFLGERAPRRTGIHGDTSVRVEDERVILTGPDKEAVGQTAADIEQLTSVPGKDTRVFQDGVYITNKPATEGV